MVRRVLMLTYFFPPVAGVGVERSLKHATYLPLAGWMPVVVAPANSAYRLVDSTTLDRLPRGIEVHRSLTLEPGHLRHAMAALRRAVASGAPPAADPHAPVAADHELTRPTRPGPSDGEPGSPLRTLLNRAWAAAIPLLYFPDEQLLWTLGAMIAAIVTHRRDPVDAIYSSSPPISGHLAAAALRPILGVPWIADFRDPWIGNAYQRPLAAPYRLLQASLERSIIAAADRSVFASAGVRDEYAERYPAFAHRLVTIPNGYDLREIDALPAADAPTEDGTPFRLVFTGSMQYLPELELLVDGLELLLARRPDLRERLRVDFVGWFSPETQVVADRRFPALEPVVRRFGFVPKQEALAHLRSADAAFIVLAAAPGRAHVPPAKLFEYIGLDRPVLAIAPPGEARRILDELGWGLAADPTPEGVAGGIERLLSAAPSGGTADPERRYERSTLSRRLAALLDEVVKAAG